ncbi:hypothetical protein CLAFUW4_00733 [Fulvia fulva]|nr:hypothetical protein CLAFUR4_00734 [Fulvia fulva]WPV08115.1 hypothetical protein CLAFUW4_00733 [Fulvia fulva]WPV24924.1 hypothetical protein CLAFUW7_00738 [Fulvia fulva]
MAFVAAEYIDAHHSHSHPHPHFQSQHGIPPDPSTQPGFYNPNASLAQQMSCDIKPRLTKEQHDILESHYQKQNKPNTNTKKGFAESLNVSLDKVNNWFQNRRAKSKQDAKKQLGAFGIYAQQQQQQQQQIGNLSYNSASNTETSPVFQPSADYYAMMQQFAADDQMPIDMPAGQTQQSQDQSTQALPFAYGPGAHHHFSGTAVQRQTAADMFDSPQEMNRRTLTQEQFDALAQNGEMMHSSGHFDNLTHGFSGGFDAFGQAFPDKSPDDFQQQDAFAFPAPLGTPLSSNDSSVPSTISEHSMFPSSAAMQDQANLSATSSEWGDSRSSSVSLSQNHDHSLHQMAVPASQPMDTSSQWQPGQSVPVDPNALQQQFREASAQRQQQQTHAHAQGQSQVPTEQPLAWPSDEAFVRRDSQNGTMLAQQMSSFALQTPQPSQTATFKSPAPPSDHSGSIAARRQRPRPQQLGITSLRSQSYGGVAPPISPSHPAAQNLTASGQQLRRIRSSNVLHGGVSQGRVMKSTPGSAQRSPLAFTFGDSMNSPKAARHASTSSTGNLAPPTPLSPSELPNRPTFPPWQSSSGQYSSRQASISETDAEHGLSSMPSANASGQNVSSPPQTPMFHHHGQQFQPFNQCRVGGNAIIEHTPPQSAPAAQQTFPSSVFMAPQHNTYGHPYQQGYQTQHPPQQFMNVSVPEQQLAGPPASFAPAQHFAASASETQSAMPMAMPMQFANGVPIVNAQGTLTMGFPPQMPQMQFVQHPSQQGPPPQMQTSPQGGQYNFMAAPGMPAGMAVTAQMPKAPSQPASEFFVHEYSPPQDIKRSATPRKPQSDGPKNYTFANQGPEHFGKDRAKKGSIDKTASSSPASASSC